MISSRPTDKSHPEDAGSEASAPDVHVSYARLLDNMAQLCDELEHIADLLPATVDAQLCLSVARRLPIVVQNAHDFEEVHVFPLLVAHQLMKEPLAATVERLRFEHWGDQDYAHDVGQALREFVRVPEKGNAEALAWMLRGFFDGVRRHLAFDQAFLVPMVEEISGRNPTGGSKT